MAIELRPAILVLLAAVVGMSLFGQDVFAQGAEELPGDGRAVLITGASTGIGRLTAELLAGNGFHVYAGARKQSDLEELDAIENIEAIRLDVTKQDEIDAAVEHVTSAGRGLYGLINNAGILVVAPMIEVREDDLLYQLDVNLLGVYRVTKAFAPLIIESGGRISTTSSIAGFGQYPFSGPYTISKHAVESLTDALSLEMRLLGVHVSTVEPGNFNSNLESSMIQKLADRGYGGEGSHFQRYLGTYYLGSGDRSEFKEPADVAQAFLHAMSAEEPKRRYLVAPTEPEARAVLQMVFDRIAQLNADQPYELEREELIGMLDRALEQVN
jgi:NAD(P)-dependent dehydrogenase (short-subunit alcohol dehydrogenase family)